MDAESSIGDNRHPMTPARTLCLSGWLLSSSLFAADDSRPDIVWIVAEDLSPDASCYGETAIQTPHLDALAARGVRFSRAFVTTPNRSVSHTGMITGVYPTTLGAHHHYNQRLERRSGNSKPYEASYRPPVKLVPELLQEAGYFTSLDRFPPTKRHGKASYNFEFDVRAVYDTTNFRECPREEPLFAQIMLAGGRHRDAAHGTSPENVSLPPYYPDTPAMRRDRADYLNAWIQTDNEVGGDGLAVRSPRDCGRSGRYRRCRRGGSDSPWRGGEHCGHHRRCLHLQSEGCLRSHGAHAGQLPCRQWTLGAWRADGLFGWLRAVVL